jgi:hypothetical protein
MDVGIFVPTAQEAAAAYEDAADEDAAISTSTPKYRRSSNPEGRPSRSSTTEVLLNPCRWRETPSMLKQNEFGQQFVLLTEGTHPCTKGKP